MISGHQSGAVIDPRAVCTVNHEHAKAEKTADGKLTGEIFFEQTQITQICFFFKPEFRIWISEP
jgi:hypothetical protein